jgi:AraC family transcriptional regulator
MILSEFPELQWLKRQAEESFRTRRDWKGNALSRKGWPNVILNVQANSIFRDNIRGPLTIFTNLSGESIVEVESKRTTIKEGFFFVSNHDQYYTLDIHRSAETFNIHFGEYFADSVLKSIGKPANFLLENEFIPPAEPVAFHNRVNIRSRELTGLIYSIKSEMNSQSIFLEEQLMKLIEILLADEKKVRKIEEKLPVIKLATKQEILKRLVYATDFIYSNYNLDINLDQLASASCLSKFHFLRLFKIAYNKTPGQFIQELRITKAVEQLENSDIEINALAKSLGYSNPSSFSRMFRNQVGVHPTFFRNS